MRASLGPRELTFAGTRVDRVQTTIGNVLGQFFHLLSNNSLDCHLHKRSHRGSSSPAALAVHLS